MRRASMFACALALACDAGGVVRENAHRGAQERAEPGETEGRGGQGRAEPVEGGEGGAQERAEPGGQVRAEPRKTAHEQRPGPAIDRRAACLARNADVPVRYRRIVEVFCAEHHNLEIPGASLAIAEGGAITLTASAGVGCLEGQEVTAATRFRIGSITKLLTAALVLRTVDLGLLRLDEPVARVLPELAAGVDERAARITWRHLLSHTSGLPDPPPHALQASVDWLDALGERPLWREPGELWSYSSDGYALVGLALERLGGEPFARLLGERLLAPLGQPGITLDGKLAEETGAACGHLGRGTDALEFSVAVDVDLGTGGADWALPAGGAIASASELVALALSLVDPQRSPLSPATQAELLRAEVPTWERPGERYGLGLRARTREDGTTLYGHAGNTADFAADLVFEPERGFALALLSNSGDHLRATLALALQELLGVAPERAAPPGARERYVGVFAGPDAWAEIAADGDLLKITAPALALDGATLEHAGDHRFSLKDRPDLGGFTVIFAAGEGRASDLRARAFVGRRVE